MKKLIDLIKMLCSAIKDFHATCVDLAKAEAVEHKAEIAERKAEIARKRQEALERQKQDEALSKARAIANIERTLATCFSDNFADALNALPAHLRISQTQIDARSLRNHFNGDVWILTVNVDNVADFSPSKRKLLQEQLQLILNNMQRECDCRFYDYIYADASEWQELLIAVSYGQATHKTEADFKRNYISFYHENVRKLYQLLIVDITATSLSLRIQYKVVSDEFVRFFSPENYQLLIASILNQ